ncbi:MAG: sodium/proton-translocating pyrophosphatase, partial [Acidimicrobiia bacterium]|nr:sodium/proton-translocating pyrophosphatase [Acidimicrobiia bacterium]
MTTYVILAVLSGVAALGLAFFFAQQVNAVSQGNDRMVELAAAIREGAMAFLKREGQWVSVFVAVMAILIATLLEDGWQRSIAYILGAALSFGAGFIGMRIATAANARTTEAARTGGIVAALPIAFRGGAVMGFTVAGLGLLGVSLGWLYLINVNGMAVDKAAEIIAA